MECNGGVGEGGGEGLYSRASCSAVILLELFPHILYRSELCRTALLYPLSHSSCTHSSISVSSTKWKRISSNHER